MDELSEDEFDPLWAEATCEMFLSCGIIDADQVADCIEGTIHENEVGRQAYAEWFPEATYSSVQAAACLSLTREFPPRCVTDPSRGTWATGVCEHMEWYEDSQWIDVFCYENGPCY